MSAFVDFADFDIDWKDEGKSVELKSQSGLVLVGELDADVGFNGEDEYPIWTVVLPDGRHESPWDYAGIRFT